MAEPALVAALREKIIAQPEMILEDRDLMRALIAANERRMGDNVVDLRGIAMERLEARLDRLEDTHRSVIAAAYDNLAGMNQIHRAILRLLEAAEFEEFLHDLGGPVADILRLDGLKLVLETHETAEDPALRRLGQVLCVAEPGFVDAYMLGGRAGARPVVLRPCPPEAEALFGAEAGIRSEALMRLDFGPGRLPGMLAMGAAEAGQFQPAQGTDLLAFFAGVFERAMRRWLA